MSQYLLINRVQVQGANAVAGFTWGFPSITHFLGYSHNLSRKLKCYMKDRGYPFQGIHLSGCAVIAHHHQVHTYSQNQFVQSKNPPYKYKEPPKNILSSPPVIEEGKMNMTFSLLIQCDGDVGNRKDALIQWLSMACKRQRVAGGTVLDIADINLFTIDNDQSRDSFFILRQKLLPGFVLQDRSEYLEEHFTELQKNDENTELFDAWLDFCTLKQKARPEHKLINDYLINLVDSESSKAEHQKLLQQWQEHIEEVPYHKDEIPERLKNYFSSFKETKSNKSLLTEWQKYCDPDEKTNATWEYIDKPKPGFLVPIMVGYRAISELYTDRTEDNPKVTNTRDNTTDVCFVEAVHSIGEWQGVHHIKTAQALSQTLWQYHPNENWYLCKQGEYYTEHVKNGEHSTQNPEDDFS